MKKTFMALLILGSVSTSHAAPAVVAAQMDDNFQDGLTWTAINAMDATDSLAGLIGAPTWPGGNSDSFWAGFPSHQTWAGIQFDTPGSSFDANWSAQTGFEKFTSGQLHGEWACQWAGAPIDVDSLTDVGAPSPGVSFYYDLQQGGTDTFDLLDTTIFGFGGFNGNLYMMSVDVYVTTDSPVSDFNGTWTPVITEAIPNADPFAARFGDGSLDPGDDLTTIVTAGVPGSAVLGMEIADDANPGVTPIAVGITGIRYDFYGWATDNDQGGDRTKYAERTTAGCRVNTFITEINANVETSGGPTDASSWNLYR